MRPTFIIMLALSALGADVAGAAETAKPQLPDPEYCTRRDADPEKCVIQDGPPQRPIVRKKKEAPKIPPPPAEPPASKPPALIGR